MGDTTIGAAGSLSPAKLGDFLPAARTGVGTPGHLTTDDLLALTQRKSLFINGGFDVWQKGTSYAATVAAVLGLGMPDLWYAGQLTLAQTTFSQVVTPTAGFNAALKVLLTGTSANLIFFGTIVEGARVRQWQGRTGTLVIRAIKGSSWNPANVGVRVITGTVADQGAAQLNGGGWTGQADAVNTTFAPTAAWSVFSVPNVTIPANAQELALHLTAQPTGAAVDANSFLQITGIDFVENTQAPAAWTPRDVAAELIECQRHWEKSYDYGVLPGSNSLDGLRTGVAWATTNCQGSAFRVSKRAAAILSIWSRGGTASRVSDASSGTDVASVITAGTGSNVGTDGFHRLDCAGGALTTNHVYEFHYVADAQLN